MSAAAPSYRFELEVDALARFFVAYEVARRAGGIGTTLEHVSVQQRVDTVSTILGLNASEGWRRIGGEGAKALWLRYLRPVLAETRESAQALEATLERGALPGRFEPEIEEPRQTGTGPTDEPDGIGEAETRAPPPDAAALARAARAEALRRRLRSPAVRILLGVVAIGIVAGSVALLAARGVISFDGSSGTAGTVGTPTAVEPASLAPYVQSRAVDETSLAKPADELKRDAYRAAVAVTNAALAQREGALTPEELARFYAGESDTVREPAIFLAAMLDEVPAVPDQPIPSDGFGPVLRSYAAAAAAVETGLPTVQFLYLVEDTGDPALAILAVASGGENPSPAAVPTTWPSWLRWLAFLPLVPALIWSIAGLPRALRAGLRNAERGATGAPVALDTGPMASTVPRASRWLARQLSARAAFAGRRLHSERTVRATLAAGGLPTLVMRPSMRTVDIVFLVARRHRHDHERDRMMRYIDALKRGGVPLFAYDYDPDPRTLRPLAKREDDAGAVARQARLSLRALRELHGDARLVLVTDGRELVDFFTQRALPFVRELRVWPEIMLLTPVPVADWGEREMNLSEALNARIGRATEDGLAAMINLRPRAGHRLALGAGRAAARAGAGMIGRTMAWLSIAARMASPAGREDRVGPRPDAVALEDAALISDMEPPEAFQATLVAGLRDWLGRPGFQWLAACAAYPQTRFNITLYLGLTLTFTTRRGPVPLYDETTLAQLSALPWFRTGRMPQWLRRRLFASLGEATRRRVMTAIDAMLAGDAPAGNDGGRQAELTIWRPENRALDIPPDAVLADMMLTERTDLVPILSGARFREVFRETLRGVALHRGTVLGLTFLWCLAAWWLTPDMAAPPAAPGAWLPLAGLVGLTLLGLFVLGVAMASARLRSGRRPGGRPAAGPVPPDDVRIGGDGPDPSESPSGADGSAAKLAPDASGAANSPDELDLGSGEDRRWK